MDERIKIISLLWIILLQEGGHCNINLICLDIRDLEIQGRG